MSNTGLTGRQQQILDFIDGQISDRGYPPSVREIGDAVGLTSPSTVHSHLATLQDRGFIRRDPSKPRAIEICLDPTSGAAVERGAVRHVPLVGDVAAGTDVIAAENVEESLPLPAEFTGDGDLFMLRVRGDSMVDAGILDGDHVVARVQQTANAGDITNVVTKHTNIPNVKLNPTVKTGSKFVYIKLPNPIIVVNAESKIALPVVDIAFIILICNGPSSSV